MGSPVVLGIAARAHVHAFGPVVRQAWESAGLRTADIGAMTATVADLLVRAGAEPAPPEVSIDPSAPLEYAAPHPVARRAGLAA